MASQHLQAAWTPSHRAWHSAQVRACTVCLHGASGQLDSGHGARQGGSHVEEVVGVSLKATVPAISGTLRSPKENWRYPPCCQREQNPCLLAAPISALTSLLGLGRGVEMFRKVA